MQYQKYEGIVVNRRGVGDADRFLTILTRDAGKISVYARAVRTVKSKRAGSLDLFSRISFEVAERGDHRTLMSVTLLDSYQRNKQALVNISRLFELGELVDTLLPEDDPQAEVYDLLETALTHLARFETPEYLTRFKKKLLALLGFGTPAGDLDTYIESLISRSLRSKNFIS